MLISSLEGTSVPMCLKMESMNYCSLLYSTRHIVQIFSRMLNNKYLLVDHISGCNRVIKAYSKIVCHALSRHS